MDGYAGEARGRPRGNGREITGHPERTRNMASVYKRGRWVDANGRKCRKDSPGAKWVESRFWTVQYFLNGKPKMVKGYTDKGASEQLGAKLERAKARGEVDMIDIYKPHRSRPLAQHIADWIAELRQLGRDNVYV